MFILTSLLLSIFTFTFFLLLSTFTLLPLRLLFPDLSTDFLSAPRLSLFEELLPELRLRFVLLAGEANLLEVAGAGLEILLAACPFPGPAFLWAREARERKIAAKAKLAVINFFISRRLCIVYLLI